MRDGKFITFTPEFPGKGRITNVYAVRTKSGGSRLGQIQWYAPWRQYTFDPDYGTTYSAGCLGEIAQFIEREMADRKRSSCVVEKAKEKEGAG
jgi:hypothetical protein